MIVSRGFGFTDSFVKEVVSIIGQEVARQAKTPSGRVYGHSLGRWTARELVIDTMCMSAWSDSKSLLDLCELIINTRAWKNKA
jgi:hypothetical protein